MSEHAVNAEHLDDGARPGEHSWPGDLTAVETPFGVFAAVDDGKVTRIRNIRYARAERFAPPVPVDPDPHEASARQYQRLGCPQPAASSDGLFGGTMRGVEFDEDCLRLSITRPSDWAGEPLPVMVWVHGGSYVSGAGDVGGYDPAALVREQRVVVVTVTYRLGVLGFLGDGEPGGRPANLGLLDIIEALRWVRSRIGGFGGDPERVTVFGQSAGADAIAHLLVASGADGLVTRAILQSAPFGIRQRRGRLQERMRRAAGPLATDAALDDLFAAQARAGRAAAGFGLRSGMPFSPQYGHAPLPPEREVAAGWRRQAPELDVLVCSTTEEAAFFLELAPKLRSLTAKPVIGPRSASDSYAWRPTPSTPGAADGSPDCSRDRARGCRSPGSTGDPRAAASGRPMPSSSRCCSRTPRRGRPRDSWLPTAPSRSSRRAHRCVRRGASSPVPDGSRRRRSAWARDGVEACGCAESSRFSAATSARRDRPTAGRGCRPRGWPPARAPDPGATPPRSWT